MTTSSADPFSPLLTVCISCTVVLIRAAEPVVHATKWAALRNWHRSHTGPSGTGSTARPVLSLGKLCKSPSCNKKRVRTHPSKSRNAFLATLPSHPFQVPEQTSTTCFKLRRHFEMQVLLPPFHPTVRCFGYVQPAFAVHPTLNDTHRPASKRTDSYSVL